MDTFPYSAKGLTIEVGPDFDGGTQRTTIENATLQGDGSTTEFSIACTVPVPPDVLAQGGAPTARYLAGVLRSSAALLSLHGGTIRVWVGPGENASPDERPICPQCGRDAADGLELCQECLDAEVIEEEDFDE